MICREWSISVLRPRIVKRRLLVFFLHALGLVVRNALVTVDAGLLLVLRDLVHLGTAQFLPLGVHAFKAVAIAAFARVHRLHTRPLMLGQTKPIRLELLLGIDGAHQLAPQLGAGLDLAYDLVRPVLGHMAVRTGGSHAGAIAVVDGLLVLLVHVVTHLMARDTELHRVGGFHGSVETTPEKDTCDEPQREQTQQ